MTRRFYIQSVQVRIAALLAAGIVLALAIFASTAYATWPQAFPSDVCRATATADGGLVLRHYSDKLSLYDSSGTLVNSTATGLDGCQSDPPQNRVTADGTILATGTNSSNKTFVVAYKNNAILWQKNIVDRCGNQMSSYTHGINIGADGNATLRIRSSCPGQSREMMSLRPSDGTVIYHVAIEPWSDPMGQSPYSGGVVYKAGNKFVYLDHSGALNTTKTFTVPAPTQDWYAAGYDGNVAVYIRDTNGVYGTSGKYYVYFRGSNGSATVREVPGAPSGARLKMLPSGDLLTTGPTNAECSNANGYATAAIIPIDSNKPIACLYNPWPSGSNNQQNVSEEWVDANGNIYAVGLYHKSINWTDRGHTIISTFSSTGALRNVFSTEQINQNETHWMGSENLAMYDGHLFGVFGDYWSTYSTKTARKITQANVAMEYPSGLILGHANPGISGNQYVALGDSFSSGEGNPPFDAWTDYDGVNECHRSNAAYPRLLAADGSLGLNLVDFAACSGATTSNVLNGGTGGGSWGAPPQVNALSSATDVVTITIGGNDVGFKDFAYACLFPINVTTGVCDEFTDIYDDTMDKITNELPAKLEATYEALLQKAPNAQIYVVGYPHLAPIKTISDPFEQTCGGLYDEFPNNWGDARAARDVVDAINGVIASKVAAVNTNHSTSRLVYVDTTTGAFLGHDACSSTSYFNGIDYVNSEYSVHPNGGGHSAYYSDVKDAIN